MGRAIYVVKKAGPVLLNHFYAGKGKFTDTPALDGLKTYKTRAACVKAAVALANKGHAVRVVYYPDGL
jgi:hypothetical protein